MSRLERKPEWEPENTGRYLVVQTITHLGFELKVHSNYHWVCSHEGCRAAPPPRVDQRMVCVNLFFQHVDPVDETEVF